MKNTTQLIVISFLILSQLAIVPELSPVYAHESSRSEPSSHPHNQHPEPTQDNHASKSEQSDQHTKDQVHKADSNHHQETVSTPAHKDEVVKETEHKNESDHTKPEHNDNHDPKGDCYSPYPSPTVTPTPSASPAPASATSSQGGVQVVLASNTSSTRAVLGAGVTTLPATGTPWEAYSLISLFPMGWKLRKYTAK